MSEPSQKLPLKMSRLPRQIHELVGVSALKPGEGPYAKAKDGKTGKA